MSIWDELVVTGFKLVGVDLKVPYVSSFFMDCIAGTLFQALLAPLCCPNYPPDLPLLLGGIHPTNFVLYTGNNIKLVKQYIAHVLPVSIVAFVLLLHKLLLFANGSTFSLYFLFV